MSKAQTVFNQKEARITLRPKYDEISECSVCHGPIRGNWKVCRNCKDTPEGVQKIEQLKKRAKARSYSSTSNLLKLIKRNEDKLRNNRIV